MCPTFCSRALHVSTRSQHFIFLIALYAYGRKIMSFFVCFYCVAWYPRTDCSLNTSWVTSKVVTVRVLTACFLPYTSIWTLAFVSVSAFRIEHRLPFASDYTHSDCWRHTFPRFVSLGTLVLFFRNSVPVKLSSASFYVHCMVHGLLVTARARFNISVNVSYLICPVLETQSKRRLRTRGIQTLHMAHFPRRPR
jgi:hypothetical protein